MGDEELRPDCQEATRPRTKEYQSNMTGSSFGELFTRECRNVNQNIKTTLEETGNQEMFLGIQTQDRIERYLEKRLARHRWSQLCQTGND